MQENPLELTKRLARFVSETKSQDIPPVIFEHAKVAFMDWLSVTLAGKDEDLVEKLIKYADIMGGHPQATVLGYGVKKSIEQAALINGATSHALDFDDTLEAQLGHPSVTLFPALLALAEWKGLSGVDFLTSYIIGIKVGAVIGSCAGMPHYMAGSHATSTIGHLASAAACAKLLRLNELQTVYALGIAGTQASGFKRVFGTMCKPFHAGRASQVGLMSALLASDGFTSAEDILEGPQGFFDVLKGEVNKEVVSTLGVTWDIENLAQKYHASCHATHSPIEAILTLIEKEKITPRDIKSMKVFVSQLALGAAGKVEPITGLDGKFSISYCVVNALLRGDTGKPAFTDQRVQDPEIMAYMKKITVQLDEKISAVEARIEVETNDSKTYAGRYDILKNIPDLETKKIKIAEKYLDLCLPILGKEKAEEMKQRIKSLEKIDRMQKIIELI
ncbi:MAG: MmgE/PrpD family protein [Geobacteraceae bacterium]